MYSMTLCCNLSKSSGAKGWLILFQSTESAVSSSFTVNLSLGDLPVNSPVFIHNAPVSFKVPKLNSNVLLIKSSLVAFQV